MIWYFIELILFLYGAFSYIYCGWLLFNHVETPEEAEVHLHPNEKIAVNVIFMSFAPIIMIAIIWDTLTYKKKNNNNNNNNNNTVE